MLEEYTVSASTWAIFSGSGTSLSIQELEQRIVTEWLPTSGYEYTNAPDIEVYINADPQNAQYEVWIPVIKK
ncbi:GyrI-like domain-containing protein [Acetobacterium paludosum]|uniref:GyrI-like domain-containing protein n=1 Tax=Acetobacterium paludosum TaxID=52693 RepID=UPI003B75C520